MSKPFCRNGHELDYPNQLCNICLERMKDPNEGREGYEFYEGQWRKVVDGSRMGWWRFHEHYDRDGFCDNPARGY